MVSYKINHKLINRFLIVLLLLTFTYIRLYCHYSYQNCSSNEQTNPFKLKYAIERLEAMVEKRLPNSGLTMKDIKDAYEEKMNYTTWRKLMSQKVLDLFYDIVQFTEGEKKSPLISDKYKPTTIDDFESWYRKLRPYYFKAALIELEEMLKEIKEDSTTENNNLVE